MKRKRRFISTLSIIIILAFIIVFILIKNKSLANDISFTSKNYNIGDNIITNISPNTDVSLFGKYFDTVNCHITITNENNEPLTNGFIYTGSKTNLYDATNNLIKSYTNIITGDIDYDGLVDIKDIKVLATYLIEENNLDDYQKKAIDINKDNEVKINDLTLLESYLNTSYESLTFNEEEITLFSNEQERLVPTINPNIILNQNLNWTSSNEDVITVDEAGKITAHNEGESIITATTKDGLKTDTVRIIVDNKPKLSEETINIYSGPKLASVNIRALDYKELSCTSSDESKVECSIEDDKLIIKQIEYRDENNIVYYKYGTVTITVTSPTYGTTELTVNITFTRFSVFPKYSCIIPNSNVGGGAISPLNAGKISLHEIYEVHTEKYMEEGIEKEKKIRTPSREIVSNLYLYTNGISISAGPKIGTSEIDFIESNGNNISTITVNTYRLSLANTNGTTTVGTNLTTSINAENTGNLSCEIDKANKDKASCLIEDNNLIITPLAPGKATITINGSTCGSATYTATITESESESNEGGNG